jgi:hypothetical protein
VPPNPLATPSLVLSVLVLAAATFLGVREWLERRGRDEDIGPGEEAHLMVRDVRRRAGIILMVVMGALASVGYWINPAAGRDDARRVFATWVAIGLIMIVMMVLASLDWLHTVRFARRARQDLASQRAEFLASVRQRLADRGDGRPDQSGTDGQDQ